MICTSTIKAHIKSLALWTSLLLQQWTHFLYLLAPSCLLYVSVRPLTSAVDVWSAATRRSGLSLVTSL